MKDSTKNLLASIIIFACSIGFFVGAFTFGGATSGSSNVPGFCTKGGICEFQPGDCCQKNLDCCKRNAPCCQKKAPCGPDSNCPQCRRHHGEEFVEGPHHKGDHFRDEFHKGKKFDKKLDFAKEIEFIDAELKVTHEQKAALEQQRKIADSTFKALRKQKKEAEKALRDALESNNDKQIAAAKANILKAQEGLLNHRIDGVKSLKKILNQEQLDKFKFLQFERMNREHRGNHGDHNMEHHD